MSEESDAAKNSLGLPYWPGNATLCTKALYLFLSDYRKTFDYLFFVAYLAGRADEVRTSAAKTLYEISDDDAKKKEVRRNHKIARCNDKAMGRVCRVSLAHDD